MKPKKPLALTFYIDGYQEDAIVGVSLKETYTNMKKKADVHEWPENREELLKAIRCVYHYYTGETLK